MAIKKLSQMIDEGELDIRNIRKLDVTPKLDSAELQAAFDQNSENLVKAIDSGIVDGIIGEDYASKEYVDSVVIATGAGDMTKFTYDTNADGVVNAADTATTATNATNDADGNAIASTYVKVESLTELVLNLAYPVGSIKMTTSNVNPSTYLGGTWAAWGSGKVPVGVSTDTEFNTVEKTGGAKTVNASHTHAIAARTSGSTTSGLPAHTHTYSGTTSSAGAHTHASAGAHSHTVTHSTSIKSYKVGGGTGSTYYYWTTSSGATATNGASISCASGGSHQHASAGAHTHTWSGTTSSNGSGSAHTHSVPAATSAAGGSTAQSTLQPYITCYMWKRTA